MNELKEIEIIMENLTLFIPLIIAALSFAVKVYFDVVESKHRINELEEKKIQDRRSVIIKKLHEFFGPFQQRMDKSTILYRALIIDKPENFRLLKYLLDSENEFPDINLTQNDKTLIEEIIGNGKELQQLITDKAGLITDPILSYDYSHSSDEQFPPEREDLRNLGLLGWADAHYRILELAYNGKLKEEVGKFEHYVFPRELRTQITRRINELTSELDQLSKLSTKKYRHLQQIVAF